ncbi:MAG: 23S rRNA (guanosine(2251)-2'-O)-methyltransferase RlmB [Holosporales bacterium]|nr:23S rRNA (guanosine(2251)-2'-O)-methyltransferase RlmB [Holosporales bacterium]
MLIYGTHACKSAVLSRHNEIQKIYVLTGKPLPAWLTKLPQNKFSYVSESDLKKMLPPQAVHQGITIEVNSVQHCDITDLISTPTNCVIAILDNVIDPHNLGAIIRSAAAFGVYGIILPERSSCKITGVVAKAASGGIDHVSIFIVKNLSQTMKKLKEYGFWIIAFSEYGNRYSNEIDFSGKTCLVFGSEGEGIRKLQLANSDFVVKLPTSNKFSTLNVATSAAIAFYEVSRQKYTIK